MVRDILNTPIKTRDYKKPSGCNNKTTKDTKSTKECEGQNFALHLEISNARLLNKPGKVTVRSPLRALRVLRGDYSQGERC